MPLKISRILHAGYVFEFEDTTIAFDPIFENPFSINCYAFPDVQFDEDKIKALHFDAVFISHHHDDHCSLKSLNLLSRETPIYLYCVFEELFEMLRKLGFKNVYPLELDVALKIGSMCITPRRAVDEDVDAIFQISAGEINVLNVVDAWIHPQALEQLAKQLPWDIVLWPFQSMRELEVVTPSRASPGDAGIPEELLEMLQALQPRIIVPSSCQFRHEDWSWYNHALFSVSYFQFHQEILTHLPLAQVLRLNPSQSVSITKNSLSHSAPLDWIRPVGEQDVDYNYQLEHVVPSTAEIAKRFPPLMPEQREVVFTFCRSEILTKHSVNKTPIDAYFDDAKIWRLSLFDHDGMSVQFHYQIRGAQIAVLNSYAGPIDWATEVPMTKLFSALENGETFTSMYFRINDIAFDPDMDARIAQVDVFADPLVRCLFGGVFAAYQRQQLKELRS